MVNANTWLRVLVEHNKRVASDIGLDTRFGKLATQKPLSVVNGIGRVQHRLNLRRIANEAFGVRESDV